LTAIRAPVESQAFVLDGLPEGWWVNRSFGSGLGLVVLAEQSRHAPGADPQALGNRLLWIHPETGAQHELAAWAEAGPPYPVVDKLGSNPLVLSHGPTGNTISRLSACTTGTDCPPELLPTATFTGTESSVSAFRPPPDATHLGGLADGHSMLRWEIRAEANDPASVVGGPALYDSVKGIVTLPSKACQNASLGVQPVVAAGAVWGRLDPPGGVGFLRTRFVVNNPESP
jgi:hypothetical protein